MEQYINKDKIVAEIERLITNGQTKLKESEECKDDESYVAWAEHIATCINILSFLDTLEVKEVDLETDIEKEYVECNIDIFNRKFPNLPELKGQYLHDYKNFLNTCKQIFKFHYWDNHPTQKILFEKLSLLCVTWGAQHLKNLFEMSSEGLQKMDVEVKEIDFENEVKLWIDENTCNGYCSASIYDTAEHFFALGLKASKGELKQHLETECPSFDEAQGTPITK